MTTTANWNEQQIRLQYKEKFGREMGNEYTGFVKICALLDINPSSYKEFDAMCEAKGY
jgi:hypothetical protein